MQALSIILYILVAGGVVFFSVKLSDFVDLLDKKTNLSGALLGGILLAAVTSLPEFFTSITATLLIKDNHYVVGNILGSDVFNLVLFAIIYIFFYKNLITHRVNKFHLISNALAFLLFIISSIACMLNHYGLIWGWFNPMSILVIAVYAFSIWKTPKIDEGSDGDGEDTSKLTVKQITILFILFSVLLIGASIGMTYIVDWICSLFNLGATFGGALFLAVATSLPELTATITLSKKGNFNAAYGNILGSNVFNFFILGLSDVFAFEVKNAEGHWIGTYVLDQSTFLLLICGAFSIIVTCIAIVHKLRARSTPTIKGRIAFITYGLLLIASYTTFLILSNINLGLAFAPFVS